MAGNEVQYGGTVTLETGEFLAIEKALAASIDLLAAIDERALQFAPEVRVSCERLTERLNHYRGISHGEGGQGRAILNRRKAERRSSSSNRP